MNYFHDSLSPLSFDCLVQYLSEHLASDWGKLDLNSRQTST